MDRYISVASPNNAVNEADKYVKGKFKLSGGFGIPSAGMLRISEGSKSFGVLGQDKILNLFDELGIPIPFSHSNRGMLYPMIYDIKTVKG